MKEASAVKPSNRTLADVSPAEILAACLDSGLFIYHDVAEDKFTLSYKALVSITRLYREVDEPEMTKQEKLVACIRSTVDFFFEDKKEDRDYFVALGLMGLLILLKDMAFKLSSATSLSRKSMVSLALTSCSR